MARRFLPLLGALLIASPVASQTHRVAVTFMGGGATFGDMADESATEIRMADGWMAGLQLERWFGRVGLRLNGGVTERTLADDPTFHMNLYTGDMDLMFRFRRPEPYRWFMPYMALGAGASVYNIAGDGSVVGGEPYGPDPVVRPMAVGALGFDIGGGPVVLRIEAFDQVDILSPLEKADGTFYGPVQRMGASVGFSVRLGGGFPAPRLLAEEPVAAPATEALEPERVLAVRPEPVPTATDPALVQALTATIESLSARVAELERAVAMLAARPEPVAAPEPLPEPEPAPQPRPEPATRTLYTVQIASFLEGEAHRAQKVVDDMRDRGLPIWVAHAEVGGRVVHRVRIGALLDRDDAHALGMYINRTYRWPFWVARVEIGEPVPVDAVAVTRSFLDSANN